MKRFLSQLRTPVIPFDLFNELVGRTSLTVEYLQGKMRELEATERTKFLTLVSMLQFFVHDVIPRKDQNLMTVQNVGICMAPCIMWAKERSLKDIIYSTIAINILNTLTLNFESIFGDRKAQHNIFRSSYLHQKKMSFQENLSALEVDKDIDKSKGKEDLLEEPKTPEFNPLRTTFSIIESLAEESDDEVEEEAPTQEIHSIGNPNRIIYRSHLVGVEQGEPSKKEEEEETPKFKSERLDLELNFEDLVNEQMEGKPERRKMGEKEMKQS